MNPALHFHNICQQNIFFEPIKTRIGRAQTSFILLMLLSQRKKNDRSCYSYFFALNLLNKQKITYKQTSRYKMYIDFHVKKGYDRTNYSLKE